MPKILQGGCRVSYMREGRCITQGNLSIWYQVSRMLGAKAISLRILEFTAGLSPGIRNKESDEVLYFLEDLDKSPDANRATVFIDGWSYEVWPQTGIFLRPGQTLTIRNPGPDTIVFVSSQCPEPRCSMTFLDPVTTPGIALTKPERLPVARLIDQATIPTGDRWYRVLVDDKVGSTQVTQFVGSIPPGRAPDHFHKYEEVLFILGGAGRMWAGDTNTLIGPGSCIYLPHGQLHCVENTGTAELRLLGVFYPAGSPSARY